MSDHFQFDSENRGLDSSRLNSWLTIATNIAVLAGIIILVIEIRQNSTAIRSGVLQAVSTESTPLNLALASDSTMRETWTLGMQNPGALTKSQSLQFNTMMHVWFSNAQNWFYQARSDVLDKEIADGHWTTMATMYSTSPGFRHYWDTRSYLYTPTFRRFVETDVFSREPIPVATDYENGDLVANPEIQAITDQLDELYRASLVDGTVDARLRNQLRFFTDQPTVQPPGKPAIAGQEAVSRFYRKIFESGVQIIENEYTQLTIVVHGEMATRQYVGEGVLIAPELAGPQSSKNRFFDMMIKEDGEWKILIHAWMSESSDR